MSGKVLNAFLLRKEKTNTFYFSGGKRMLLGVGGMKLFCSPIELLPPPASTNDPSSVSMFT
jgi:hypothetical protein